MSKTIINLSTEINLQEIELKLHTAIDNAVKDRYGDNPDAEISKRITEELAAIKRNDAFLCLAALYDCSLHFKEAEYPYYLNYCGAASFILYVLGISMTNPLPPHYLCPQCKTITWKHEVADGFDLPQKALCCHDNTILVADGHAIPWEPLLGFDILNFDIRLPIELFDKVFAYVNRHWIEEGEIRAEVGYYSYDRKDRGHKYINLEDLGLSFAFPTELSFASYSEKPITAEDGLNMLSNWKNYTSPITGIPVPKKFSDLLTVRGMELAEGVWDNDAQFMVDNEGYSLNELVTCREDIYTYLIKHGFTVNDALKGMTLVRTGRNLSCVTEEMRTAKDKWILQRCKKVKYLPSKAAVLEELFFKVKTK